MKDMLKDKTALIIGGSKGIGLATAKLFAEQGADVIITGRDEEGLKAAVKEIGHDATYEVSDISSVKNIKSLFQKLRERYKRLNTVFINAGIAVGGKIEDVDEETYDAQMNTNLKGAFFCAQQAIPFLQPGASIIFTASVAGLMGIEHLSVYSASKAALLSLTKIIAAELAPRGIRVNAISPGYIATPLGLRNNKAHFELISRSIPFEQRFGIAEEVAMTALFLASEMSSYTTGTNVVVDGGLSSITYTPQSKL